MQTVHSARKLGSKREAINLYKMCYVHGEFKASNLLDI